MKNYTGEYFAPAQKKVGKSAYIILVQKNKEHDYYFSTGECFPLDGRMTLKKASELGCRYMYDYRSSGFFVLSGNNHLLYGSHLQADNFRVVDPLRGNRVDYYMKNNQLATSWILDEMYPSGEFLSGACHKSIVGDDYEIVLVYRDNAKGSYYAKLANDKQVTRVAKGGRLGDAAMLFGFYARPDKAFHGFAIYTQGVLSYISDEHLKGFCLK